MTHTTTISRYGVRGNEKYRSGTIDITSFTDGGEAITAAEFALTGIYQLDLQPKENYYVVWWDETNSKIMAGNPTVAHSHTFTGSALAAHSHVLTVAELAAHSHTFAGDALATHTHTAFTVMGTETATDSTTFVSITEGDGTAQTGILVSHAGGGSDEAIVTAGVSGGTPAGTNTALTAGTPAGTLTAVTGGTATATSTGIAAGTPAGTLTGVSGGTPAGTLTAVTGGTATATSTGITAGTPAGTTTAISAAVGSVVDQTTDIGVIMFTAYGY